MTIRISFQLQKTPKMTLFGLFPEEQPFSPHSTDFWFQASFARKMCIFRTKGKAVTPGSKQ